MSIPFLNTIGTTEALLLMRNLSMTLKAGVPLPRALELFEEEAPRGGSKTLISHLKKQVDTGHSLAEAMETAPRSFPAIAVNLVKTGEIGGTLTESLETIAKYLYKALELRRKIRSAMMYPTFVLVAIFGLGISIGTMVLPQLIPLFESLDVELPLMTRVLLKVAAFFDAYGMWFGLGCLAAFTMFLLMIRLEAVKPTWHRFTLMIPLIGVVQRRASIAQLSATLATLLKSGIPIKEAIPAAAEATDNRVFRKALLSTLPVVEAGHPFGDGIKATGKTFPGMARTLIEIGEETGTLQETLEYLSDYYDAEVDYAVKNLTTALEPILLIFIGLIVGGTVMAIITPIYDVTGSIR